MPEEICLESFFAEDEGALSFLVEKFVNFMMGVVWKLRDIFVNNDGILKF